MLNINFVIKFFYTSILVKFQSTNNSLVQTNHTNIKYDFSAVHLFSPVIFMRLHLLFIFRHLYDRCTVGHLCLPEVLEQNILELRMTQFWTNDCISGLTKMIHMQMQVGIATIRATPEISSKEKNQLEIPSYAIDAPTGLPRMKRIVWSTSRKCEGRT